MPFLTLPAALILLAPPAEVPAAGLRAPDGFVVTEFADSALANDIYCMTIDDRGRVVVSGRGYVRVLIDADGDGRADRAVDFADRPKDGAMGLLAEGDALYCVGDGGLWRFRDADGDGKADGAPQRLAELKTGGEHDAHAVRRGPDGWLYVLCGNMTGINHRFAALDTSPVKEPVAGAVVRFPPSFRGSEVVADGFRNPYGMDFNLDGELFTYDSDNERCVSLPWYEPTRLYHVVEGGNYGWLAPQRAETWRRPPYFLDVVPPVAYLGRGSPTGLACYRHTAFPARYRGGLFAADWTFGRVYFVRPEKKGASYVGKSEVFLEAVGGNGFAPTALAVHPKTGDLYVSIGGRGTRGAVYRVRWGEPTPHARAIPTATRSLDWQPAAQERLVRLARSSEDHERLRGLNGLLRHRSQFDPETLIPIILRSADSPDRLIRQATARLIPPLFPGNSRQLFEASRSAYQKLTLGFALRSTELALTHRLTGPLVADADLPAGLRLEAVRVIQLALGDVALKESAGAVWEGYSPTTKFHPGAGGGLPDLREVYPSGDPDLDRELSRTFSLVADKDSTIRAKVSAQLTRESDPRDDFHNLIVLARLQAFRTREVTSRTAAALLDLDRKLTDRKLNRDRNWPLRMAELLKGLVPYDPGLPGEILGSQEFGRPDHALLTTMPGFDRVRAAEIFLAKGQADPDYGWTPQLVELLGQLPAERTRPLLRKLWDRGGLEGAILPLLARMPELADRTKFRDGLRSPQLAQVRLCVEALLQLPQGGDPDEVLALVRALRALPDGKAEQAVAERIGERLNRLTAEKFGGDRKAWSDWLARAKPDLAARLGGRDGVDAAAWAKRLAGVAWDKGDAARGKLVFQKASCAACHGTTQALGPDLAGVAGRFSRDDLFAAIIQPSKDVSARYRTTEIGTSDGKVYQGLIVYEAVDGLILQTGSVETVRVAGDKIESRRLSDVSLMPAGLLDKVADGELADLYAYLRTLGGKP